MLMPLGKSVELPIACNARQPRRNIKFGEKVARRQETATSTSPVKNNRFGPKISPKLTITGCLARLEIYKIEMSHQASAKVRTKAHCSRVKATEIIDEFKGLSIVPIPMVRTSSHGFVCVYDKTYHLACHISQDLVIF